MSTRHFGRDADDDDEEDVLSSPSDSEDEEDTHQGQNGDDNTNGGAGGTTRRRGTGILFGNVDRKIKLVENDETVRYIDEEEGESLPLP